MDFLEFSEIFWICGIFKWVSQKVVRDFSGDFPRIDGKRAGRMKVSILDEDRFLIFSKMKFSFC